MRSPERADDIRVVLFTGGRGSGVLSRELIRDPRVHLTLAVNGYDDGKSTGEVRRFLGSALGPSDFRKNAGRLARGLGTSGLELAALLDLRLPDDSDAAVVSRLRAIFRDGSEGDVWDPEIRRSAERLDPDRRQALALRLDAFLSSLEGSGRGFNFSDCSLGNLVFAGCYLKLGGNFNAAVEDYCRLLDLPPGIIQNVTDGGNAILVGLSQEGRLLASEAEIVSGESPGHIREIFLLDRPLTPEEKETLAVAPLETTLLYLAERAVEVRPNPVLLDRIREADLIIYAPGTQYSSLYPSYLTPGLGATIADNLQAIKLLITNIQEDAETRGTSAVELVDRAVYYLREKGRARYLTPCLITHYLINDPRNTVESGRLSLGSIENLEDPRLVRIGQYEDEASGRHNAAKIITPFMRTVAAKRDPPKVGVLLLGETESLDKISQTILEALRGGILEAGIRTTVFYAGKENLPEGFIRTLPFEAHNVFEPSRTPEDSLSRILRDPGFDYFILFDSTGMYRGEDIVNLASHLTWGHLDAVWGSRRLSPSEIHASYRYRYRRNPLLGAISYMGSHMLSLAYLLLYGRYVTDTLSGARGVRSDYLRDARFHLDDRALNQRLLSTIFRSRGEIFETPVQFLPISPGRVRRTSVWEGLLSLVLILVWRVRRAGSWRRAGSN